MIFYFCPDFASKSAGMRILYRHVQILADNQMEAAILHTNPGFAIPDMPAVPIRYVTNEQVVVHAGDTFVIPEGFPPVMESLCSRPLRRMAIALNWRYIYASLQGGTDWRSYGIERVLTHSEFIGRTISWAMGLPTHVFQWSVNPDLYFFDAAEKKSRIVFITRKQESIPELHRLLHSRNPDFVRRIRWRGLDGLSEADYAREVRQASVFLNLSSAEGLPCSVLEAMRAGTLVAGFNSVGGQAEMIGTGDQQNCILAENLDYVTLAHRLEPLLIDLLKGDLAPWETIRQTAQRFSAAYNQEAESRSVLSLWRELLAVRC